MTYPTTARTLLGKFSLLKEEVGQKAARQVTLGLPQAWQNQPQWRVPRLILDQAKKQQVERVRQLAKGVRPA